MFLSYSFVKSLNESPILSQMIIAKFLFCSNFFGEKLLFWKNLLFLLKKRYFFWKSYLLSEKLLTLGKFTYFGKSNFFWMEKVTCSIKNIFFLEKLLFPQNLGEFTP